MNQELKNDLNNLVHKKLYVSNFLDNEDQQKIKKIINFLKGKEDIYDDLKIILSDRNNENSLTFAEFLEKILVELDEKTKIYILENNEKYKELLKQDELFCNIWLSLKDKTKLKYLNGKRKLDNLDVLMINEAIKESSSFNDNLVLKEILSNNELNKKIPSFSINIIYSYNLLMHINLTNFEGCSILTKNTYTTLLLKKCHTFTDFYNIYEANPKIYNLIENNSLTFNNSDNEIIYEFILKNPNFIGKFSNKYLQLFNILEITKMYDNKTLDNESFSTVLQSLYTYNLDKANEYFKEDNLKKCTMHSLTVYPFDNIPDKLRTKIFNTYSLFNRFIDTIMIEAINNYFSEEDIVNLLRNSSFIDDMSSYAIELLINKLSFKAAFNMLQNKKILSKITNLNITLSNKDSIFIKGFLDSPSLVCKTDHQMVYEMLLYCNEEEILYYLATPYISNKLSNNEIIELCCLKKVKVTAIVKISSLTEKLNKTDIMNFIDKSWEDNVDLQIFNNEKITKLLFNLSDKEVKKINFNEVNYLFETIRMKSILSTQVTKYTVLTYKSVLASYLVFGLSKTIKLIGDGNKDITLDEVKELQNDIVSEKLLRFREDNAAIIQNIAKKVINNLKELENFEDINDFSKKVRHDTYLDNIIYLMLDNNYDSYNGIIETFYNFLKYFDYNEYQAKKEIYEYCNGFVKVFISNKASEYNEEFYKIILNNFKLKENILYTKRKEIGREYINKLKLKLFVRALTDVDKDSYVFAFRKDYPISEIKEKFIKYLNTDDVDFDNILEHVLIPLMNERFDFENCLNKLGIKKPKNYQTYYDYIEDIKNVTILNNEIEKLKNKYNTNELLEIMNYICYGIKITFKIKNKELKVINKNKEISEKLKGQLYVDKTAIHFIYSDNMDIYNIDEIIEYNNYWNILEEIISKTTNYIKKHMDSVSIREHFEHDYLKTINEEEFVFPITNKYYELKQRVFSLRDLENIFNGFEIASFTKVTESLQNFLCNTKNVLMIADGYYTGIVDNFGLIINSWKKIEKKCKELDVDINDLSLINIENILRLTNYETNPYTNNLDKAIIKALCSDSYYLELDLNKRLEMISKLYKDSFKIISSTIPFIDIIDDNYEIKVVDKYDQEIFKTFDNSPYKIGAIGNDFVHYSILDKNGFKIIIKKDKIVIARILGVRNGNTVYLNSIEGISDENYEKLLKIFSNKLIEKTKEYSEPIEFITIVNNKLLNSINSLKIDNTICPVVDNPINTMYIDFEDFKNNPNLNTISEGGFYNNFSDNVTVLLASSKIVDKNNFKYYDVDAKYLRKRNNVIKLSNNIEESYIKRIKLLIDLCKEEKSTNFDGDVDLNTVDTIFLGDDFVIFITRNKQIIKYILPYDERAKREVELILDSLN